MADPADFLARWSRLKRRAQAGPQAGAPYSGPARPRPDEAVPLPAASAAPPEGAAAPPANEPGKELPPIETLGKDSDYTAFMRADVPDALRNQALRKLWQSDPVFANLDGLVEYGEDFGAAFKLGGAVATVYRVLGGMPEPAAEKQAEPAAGPAATPSATVVDPAPVVPETASEPAAAQPKAGHGVVESHGDIELD